MRGITSSIMAFITLVLAVFGIGRVGDTGEFNNKQWMSALKDDIYISEISMPGTHDSCALYEPIAPSAKCQNYTISDQLDMGVRFLDIRGVVLHNKIGIVHGPIYQSKFFDDVLNDCYDFLEENPCETIIMSVKEDVTIGNSREKFISLVENHISEDSDKWYTENEIPLLGDVRGKIVLLNRYNGASGFGLGGTGWRDNTISSNPQQNYSMNVQDHYKIEKVEDKWSLATALFEDCYNCDSRSENLFINFMSGYTGKIPNIPFVAERMNPLFSEYMDNCDDGCYGIVLFDFVTPELCNKLIEKNITQK